MTGNGVKHHGTYGKYYGYGVTAIYGMIKERSFAKFSGSEKNSKLKFILFWGHYNHIILTDFWQTRSGLILEHEYTSYNVAKVRLDS